MISLSCLKNQTLVITPVRMDYSVSNVPGTNTWTTSHVLLAEKLRGLAEHA